MLEDLRLERLRRAFEARPARGVPRVGAAEAGVALVVRPRDALEILLIKRAAHERDPWSGHMALPGGRREPADPDLLSTAMRETVEETGIELARHGRFLGALDEVRPLGGRLPRIVVAPFVLGVLADTSVDPNPREVEAALWVPLAALRDEAAEHELLVELESGARTFPGIRYGDHVIWGLTHRILMQFLRVADAAGV